MLLQVFADLNQSQVKEHMTNLMEDPVLSTYFGPYNFAPVLIFINLLWGVAFLWAFRSAQTAK